jgi:hypothetical protein
MSITPPDRLSLRLFPPRLLLLGIAVSPSSSDFALEPFKRLRALTVSAAVEGGTSRRGEVSASRRNR